MELEELKKSWNTLDEHLKDKEFIKEEELEKLIRHADKGIHAIACLLYTSPSPRDRRLSRMPSGAC